MYRKAAKGWLKHWDFILLDLLCLQTAYVAAFMVRHGFGNPYARPLYCKEAIILAFIQVIVAFVGENFKSVLKRGYYNEFVATIKQVVLVILVSVFYLFLVQEGQIYSRMTLLLTGCFYLLLSYVMRLSWKRFLLSGSRKYINPHALLVLTDMENAEETVKNMLSHSYFGFQLCGVAIADQNRIGESICGIKVVADKESVVEYICREWVDQVMINLSSDELTAQVVRICNAMGVTVHRCLVDLNSLEGKRQRVERIGNYTVLTNSVNVVSLRQLFYKRTLDIVGASIGCVLTGLLFVVIAPIIYVKSPGPVFFKQIRVGKGGKKFTLYKFRSMYMDAEERKKELEDRNQIEDGMMFKMEDDPRIIKGIGHFIRKYSIDEFPQFFNVLKGEMSLVGTRPPTVDEWERYSLHHRIRLAIKPGITGLWQVSGRSNITDFEEVVKLDTKYIDEWNIGLDIKILLKTVRIVLGSNGAM